VVTAIGALTLLGVVTKRIAGGRGRHAVGSGSTDPGAQDAVRQLAAELESLHDEVSGLRRELEEAHNRLDFTERLLMQAKERGQLGAPKDH